MSLDERGTYLGYVWQRCKDRRPRISSVLPMFKNATTLRAMVPQDWPPIISVYRGSWCHEAWPQPERRARRWLRSGISWTTDRNVALTFAEDPMGGGVGVIGSATVARDAVLAYFHDVGDSGSGTYHEHECIIDPTSIDGVVYDRVIAEATADAGIGGGTVGI